MSQILKSLFEGKSLTEAEAVQAMQSILSGELASEQIGAMLTIWHYRPPVAAELTGFVNAIRSQSERVRSSFQSCDLLDVCGTGGDGSGSFNVSTTVAFVVAAAGQLVAKHGNRAVSSKCGSFDVLEALGIPFAETFHEAEISLAEFGITFLYAPAFYPVLKKLGPIRRSLGVRTIFNALGPMLNPLCAGRQLMGVYSESLMLPVAKAFQQLGASRSLIVRGEDGSDEVSLAGKTKMIFLEREGVTESFVHPTDFGISTAPLSAIAGGDAGENARLVLSVLKGEPGAYREVVLLNSAAAFLVGGKVRSLQEGLTLAAETIDAGKALKLVQVLREQPVRRFA